MFGPSCTHLLLQEACTFPNHPSTANPGLACVPTPQLGAVQGSTAASTHMLQKRPSVQTGPCLFAGQGAPLDCPAWALPPPNWQSSGPTCAQASQVLCRQWRHVTEQHNLHPAEGLALERHVHPHLQACNARR